MDLYKKLISFKNFCKNKIRGSCNLIEIDDNFAYGNVDKISCNDNSSNDKTSNKSYKGKCHKRKVAFNVILSLTMLFNIVFPTVAFAEAHERTFFDNDQREVWLNEESKHADKVKQYVDQGATQLGANYLYGSTVNIMFYRGEISDNSDDYYSNTKKILGVDRDFSDVDEGDVDDDIRANCLENNENALGSGIFTILAPLCNAGRSIIMAIFNGLVNLKEIDLTSFLDVLSNEDNGDSFFTTLTHILVRQEDGSLAPFMAIFLILWIVGMVGVTLKFVKGHAGFSLIGREIWYLVLCIILFAAAVSTDAVTKISTLSLSIATKIDQSADNADNASIFKTTISSGSGDNEETTLDNEKQQFILNQRSVLEKANIDSSLCSIFGVNSIKELNTSNFTIPDGYEDILVVSNDDGSTTASNLGYMYWAGQSIFDNQAPIKDGKLQITSTKGGHNSIHWLIPDILQASGGLEDPDMVLYKNALNDGSAYFKFFGNSFMFFFMGLSFVIAEFFALFIALEGKILLTISGIFILILPGLFLWEKSRRMGMQMVRLYIGSLLRTIIGNVIFIVFLEMFASLGGGGDWLSELMGIAIFFLLAVAMPKYIIPAINNMLEEVEGYSGIAGSLHRFNDDLAANMTYGKYKERRAKFIDKLKGDKSSSKEKKKKNKYSDSYDDDGFDELDEREREARRREFERRRKSFDNINNFNSSDHETPLNMPTVIAGATPRPDAEHHVSGTVDSTGSSSESNGNSSGGSVDSSGNGNGSGSGNGPGNNSNSGNNGSSDKSEDSKEDSETNKPDRKNKYDNVDGEDDDEKIDRKDLDNSKGLSFNSGEGSDHDGFDNSIKSDDNTSEGMEEEPERSSNYGSDNSSMSESVDGSGRDNNSIRNHQSGSIPNNTENGGSNTVGPRSSTSGISSHDSSNESRNNAGMTQSNIGSLKMSPSQGMSMASSPSGYPNNGVPQGEGYSQNNVGSQYSDPNHSGNSYQDQNPRGTTGYVSNNVAQGSQMPQAPRGSASQQQISRQQAPQPAQSYQQMNQSGYNSEQRKAQASIKKASGTGTDQYVRDETLRQEKIPGKTTTHTDEENSYMRGSRNSDNRDSIGHSRTYSDERHSSANSFSNAEGMRRFEERSSNGGVHGKKLGNMGLKKPKS